MILRDFLGPFQGDQRIAIAIFTIGLTPACGDVHTALEQLSEARSLAADLSVQFIKAADSSNRAVMANTDEASHAYAKEAGEATQVVQSDIEKLRPILQARAYRDEQR